MLKPFSSATYRKNTELSQSEGACCLCGKDTLGVNGAIHVPVNHETGEFMTDAEAAALGDKVSFYPIGPDCAKRWAREFKGTTRTRFRKSGGKLIAYDHRTA